MKETENMQNQGKRPYEMPEIQVVELERHAPLLVGSDDRYFQQEYD